MYRLADAYGWSKNDLSSFSGGEILQIVQKLIKKEKENKDICPMMNMFAKRN